MNIWSCVSTRKVSISGFEDVPHIFPGTADSRLAGLCFFGFADASLLVPLFDFDRFKRATTIPLRLLLCLTSEKGWELLLFPICGIWLPVAGSYAGGSGEIFRLQLLVRRPIIFQRDTCGPVVVPCRWLLRLNMCCSSSAMAAGRMALDARSAGAEQWRKMNSRLRVFCVISLFSKGAGCKRGCVLCFFLIYITSLFAKKKK